MARRYDPNDAHVLINALAKEITGSEATIQAVDSSTFVAVGETILQNTTENIMNAITRMAGRRFADVTPYKSPFAKLRAANSGIYSNIVGTINYYAQPALADGSTNTQLFTNLAEGFDNGKNPTNLGVDQSTASQWEQHTAMTAELWFAGTSTWQDCITRYDDQLQNAFRDEESFMDFWNGVIIEKQNDIETQKEAFDRMAVLNYIAGVIDMDTDMPGSQINMTKAYNDKFGTTYTTAQLQSTYLTEFTAFLIETIQNISGYLENRSVNYHWSLPKTVGLNTFNILRHTPKAKQKVMMLESFWNSVRARVLPAIFNDEYLKYDNFIPVKFWQNENDVAAISVTPAIPDTSDPEEQTVGDAVALDYVLGVIFDERALMTDYQLEDTSTTGKEARKHYRNTWFTFRRNAINNFSHKGVVLYMADPVPPTPDPGT